MSRIAERIYSRLSDPSVGPLAKIAWGVGPVAIPVAAGCYCAFFGDRHRYEDAYEHPYYPRIHPEDLKARNYQQALDELRKVLADQSAVRELAGERAGIYWGKYKHYMTGREMSGHHTMIRTRFPGEFHDGDTRNTMPEWYQLNQPLLFDEEQNAKMEKMMKFFQPLPSGKPRYRGMGLSLAPATMSGFNVCRYSGECAAICLAMTGRAANYGDIQMTPKHQTGRIWLARIARTRLYFMQRDAFFWLLIYDLRRLENARLKTPEQKMVVRLNVLSDIPWERTFPQIFKWFPNIQFYDYTKDYTRLRPFSKKKLPKNYHVTYSVSEKRELIDQDLARKSGIQQWIEVDGRASVSSLDIGKRIVANRGGATLVFRFKDKIPTQFMGHPVISGDPHDLRFLDPKGVWVSLAAKGDAAYHDRSGFVKDAPEGYTGPWLIDDPEMRYHYEYKMEVFRKKYTFEQWMSMHERGTKPKPVATVIGKSGWFSYDSAPVYRGGIHERVLQSEGLEYLPSHIETPVGEHDAIAEFDCPHGSHNIWESRLHVEH